LGLELDWVLDSGFDSLMILQVWNGRGIRRRVAELVDAYDLFADTDGEENFRSGR
jgi:hypothetical protein